MANKLVILVLLAASIAACNMKTYTREEASMLFDALDTKPNGYKGSTGTILFRGDLQCLSKT